jgi:hypothetical protein
VGVVRRGRYKLGIGLRMTSGGKRRASSPSSQWMDIDGMDGCGVCRAIAGYCLF